ncbi:MAG: amino acid adenylation domain-containing protein [Microcoleus sp. PH2017_10_PVI_O_A]|uniref:non-ribosomal peptide synthetase n=1 Tax=unclassified Microcoleus TaxID=2642155 RepID=UPI001DBA70F9|nr:MULTISPECIES: amino acid adenylation domain-containing protein [unclassified Microcoleus]TAE83308.1 MAG: amino acid adenylation domain-containing protein [Oscillatoriales cyanobacterium]MCC3405300.1 amino acid adenylation domain-containing protein [Microcoleus sp. PH2017_10_PVI_O_A]MCC3460417.1 amino acid adenylation domain-containing protein [Microcoleus sp. PH2017_11_PCY_U_A]MCC3478703.1 amino acid adenylation domain-containing protein [Microcoleus sp. PH2017_12_PCY_D_A]MCC3559636.1 amino
MMNSQDFLTSGDGYSPNKQTDLLKTTHDVCVGVPASSHDVSSVQEFQGDLTASDYVSIHQWFEAQVKQTPDAIALSFQGQELTYNALNQRANQLAHYLQALGVQPDELVAISMNRCMEMVICFLGVMKAGAAYVPIDPAYPHERRAYKLRDASVRFILIQQHLVEFLPEHNARVICPDTDWQDIAPYSTENLSLLTTPDHLAYVIYTSGSTGNPKGVMITHRGMVHHSKAIVQEFNLRAGDRVLQFSSMSFDIIIEEVFPSLVSGATIVLRTEDCISSTRQFLEFIEQERITILDLPTAFWHGLVSGLSLLGVPMSPDVRLVIVGGEKASRALYGEWRQLVGEYPRWLNTYGPTETTVTATIFDPIAEGYDLSSEADIPIGRPLPNSQIYILDENLNPVPDGDIGELYIGGPGVARGYLNLAERTASKFIANPFSDRPGAKLYITGDTARYLPNGTLEFIGRIDFQVKIRGFRIELLEIETYLEQHPSVQQGIVLAREDVPGEKRLVAYIIPKHGQPMEVSALRSFLQTKLPAYMIPAAVVVMESFPMTPNGKVDRRGFPEPQVADLVKNSEVVLPIDGLEAQLVQIWEQVLNIKPIGTTDNFMDLGGTSLLAARLADKIDEKLQQSWSLSMIFQAPTIKQLADILRQGNIPNQSLSLVDIQPKGSQPPLFLFEGVSIYHPLIPYLGLDRPIYGLIALVKDGVNGPVNQVEAIADYYINELVKVQPEGPYYLGGLSFGGIVAFEVAQKLAAKGQETALLVMFDSMLPSAYKPLPLDRRLRFHAQKIAKQGVGYIIRSVVDKIMTLTDRMTMLARKAIGRYNKVKEPTESMSCTTDYLMTEKIIEQAERAYVPKPYAGKVVMFRALDSEDGVSVILDPELGWKPYLKDGLTIYDVPGDHLSILQEPNVGAIGNQIKLLLEEVVVQK